MQVIIVDFGDIRIGHNDKRKVSKGMYSMGEADREQGESEVGRCK